MILGEMLISVDPAGGAPDTGTLVAAVDSRVIQIAAGLTLDDTGTTWTPAGSTSQATVTDHGATGSCIDVSWDQLATGSTAGWGAVMSGEPTASVYVAIPLNTDTGATPASPSNHSWQIVTGHPYFAPGAMLTTPDQPVPGKILMGAVVLGDTPPTITDPAGFIVTAVRDPIAFPGATLSLWTVDIPTVPDPSARILLSETIDSGFAMYLTAT